MEYIQVYNGFVNLIGGAEVGLPLSDEYLTENPNVLNLRADNYAELPKIGDYYDADRNVFIPYAEWVEANPPEHPPSGGALTPTELAELRGYLSQLPALILQMKEAVTA